MKCGLPANFSYEYADGDMLKSIADWTQLGVRAADGIGAVRLNAENGAIYMPCRERAALPSWRLGTSRGRS